MRDRIFYNPSHPNVEMKFKVIFELPNDIDGNPRQMVEVWDLNELILQAEDSNNSINKIVVVE
tara:strand:+ start:618 stop:806 length:189 start_codon:yes stop_codon:yes gene_type:complete